MLFKIKLMEVLPHGGEFFKVNEIYDVVCTSGDKFIIVNDEGYFGEVYPRKCRYVPSRKLNG